MLVSGTLVRLTSAEHSQLVEQAAAHGRAAEVPAQIRDRADLEAARYAASGGQVVEDLLEFIATGSSPATRGERDSDELFGEESKV